MHRGPSAVVQQKSGDAQHVAPQQVPASPVQPPSTEHGVDTHCPSWQTSPFWHDFPHAPQLNVSVCRLKQYGVPQALQLLLPQPDRDADAVRTASGAAMTQQASSEGRIRITTSVSRPRCSP
jgi:hypothetical protein